MEISGNTLLVYIYILKRGQNCGVREIQRALGFSSSSSAYYHLEKLTHSGVLTKDCYGNYKINDETKVRFIDRFFVIHRLVFPKQLVYASVTTLMCVFFVVLFWNSLTPTVILALSPGFLASGIHWYVAVRLWFSLPRFEKIVR